MKILIVDDDPHISTLYRTVLEAGGHEPVCAASGEEALALLEKDFFPFIILDWTLPKVSGIEVCKQIRSTRGGDLPFVLMITNRNKPEDLDMTLAAGADDYFPKPIDLNMLNIRISVAMRQIQHRTLRKIAEAELQKNREDLLALLNQLGIGTVLVDDDDTVVFMNTAAKKFSGSSDTGHRWQDSFPVNDTERERLETIADLSRENRMKIPVKMASESTYWIDVDILDDNTEDGRKMFLLYDVSEIYKLRRNLTSKGEFQHIIGSSEQIQKAFEQIRHFAGVDWNVLIEGETGTGKELAAKALHDLSNRADGIFIPVNCAGLADSLIASQLFGHRKGSFTGAIDDHKGYFEAAIGGTVFLDEIGDITPSVQVSLLRVLENKEITRVGETKPRSVDVRIVAATNKNLLQEVEKGNFRADLYYRLKTARVSLPALRKRKEDLPLLIEHFLEKAAKAFKKDIARLNSDTLRIIMQYDWPGNIRELKSALDFAFVQCTGGVIDPRDLPDEIRESVISQASSSEETPERAHILETIERAGGNRAKAARLLGVSRATFYRKLTRLGITEEDTAAFSDD